MTTQEYRTGTVEIAPNTYAFIQPGGMTNAGFIVGQDGVLVIDALMTLTLARTLQGEVRKVTSKPMRALINTHYHGDHTFGNQEFRPAPIISHVNCREELRTSFEASRQRFSANRPELAGEFRQVRMTLPDLTFRERLTLHLDGRPIELRWLGYAHTKGDILVYLPQERVIFAGDVAFHKFIPAAMDGHVSSWINVVRKANDLDAAVVVPGHGPIGTKRDMDEVRDLLRLLKREVRRRYDAGVKVDDAARDISVAKYASWLNQERLAVAVQRLYMEFRGELR
ncbi:MAG: MBL fold metallo-hydrolase [Chloroflexi bacterium]|nr:MBL fold metallo-hydrolase [Chloroflexota bacterium]